VAYEAEGAPLLFVDSKGSGEMTVQIFRLFPRVLDIIFYFRMSLTRIPQSFPCKSIARGEREQLGMNPFSIDSVGYDTIRYFRVQHMK
jgi:hypothetical protein